MDQQTELVHGPFLHPHPEFGRPRRYEECRVEILRPGGGTVWESREIAPFSFGSFSLTIPRLATGPGGYRVRLLGRTGDTEEPIDDYAFRMD